MTETLSNLFTARALKPLKGSFDVIIITLRLVHPLKKFDGIRKIVSLAEKSTVVDTLSVSAYKCFALEMLLIAGNCPDVYAESYSECKKNIFAINIPFKLKVVLAVANVSYRLAHWLRRFLTNAKEFYLKIFG